MKYIQKNSITGRLDYRKSFPIALRPDVPGKLSQLKRSLGAKDIKEPGALDNYNAASAEYERLVVLAAKRQSGSFDTLDGPAIAYMAAVFENEWQAEADRNWSYPVEDEDGTLTVNDMMLDDFVTWKREDDFDEIEKGWAFRNEISRSEFFNTIGAVAERQLLHPYCPFQPHFVKLAPFPVYKTNAVPDQYASARI